jgi:hypothetical protein
MMLRYFLLVFFSGISVFTNAQQEQANKEETIQYFNKAVFLIEGTAIVPSLKENDYDRLPTSYKEKVRKAVWDLSKSSSGLSVRFRSNSTTIKVKWEVLNNTVMNHMAPTGIKGLDLYCKTNGHWQYVNTARPVAKQSEALLINNMATSMREYKLFLPLYDGVVNLEIGIDSLSVIEKPAANKQKPIVFYGTSITQGGCASRPGMAHTNIISRKLDIDCINFGFSGNGRMEAPIAELIAETDALFYVIDCVPNMSLEQVKANAIPLVEIIRSKRSQTPIVFVESTLYEKSFLDTKLKEEIIKKNAELKQQYQQLLTKGYRQIFYIESNQTLGDDHEATVDGVHFTDLGFMRFADFLLKRFEQFKLIKAGIVKF